MAVLMKGMGMVEAIVVMVRQLQLHVRDNTHYYQIDRNVIIPSGLV